LNNTFTLPLTDMPPVQFLVHEIHDECMFDGLP
jgi:hypothetical protein